MRHTHAEASRGRLDARADASLRASTRRPRGRAAAAIAAVVACLVVAPPLQAALHLWPPIPQPAVSCVSPTSAGPPRQPRRLFCADSDRTRLPAADNRALGSGDVRVDEERRHRRVPRQLDAGAGGAADTRYRRQGSIDVVRDNLDGREVHAGRARTICTRQACAISRTSQSIPKRAGRHRFTASSQATTATGSCSR